MTGHTCRDGCHLVTLLPCPGSPRWTLTLEGQVPVTCSWRWPLLLDKQALLLPHSSRECCRAKKKNAGCQGAGTSVSHSPWTGSFGQALTPPCNPKWQMGEDLRPPRTQRLTPASSSLTCCPWMRTKSMSTGLTLTTVLWSSEPPQALLPVQEPSSHSWAWGCPAHPRGPAPLPLPPAEGVQRFVLCAPLY